MSLSNVKFQASHTELMFWADKVIQGKKCRLESGNPLVLYAFLDLQEKVEEGLEKGFEEGGSGPVSIQMSAEKVKEYADHPMIQYDKDQEVEDGLYLGTNGTLFRGNSKEENFEKRLGSAMFFQLDWMKAAILGESKQVIFWGLENHKLLDCGINEVIKFICICRNEEILSAIMEKECSSYYIEPEDALNYVNPILLRLIYEEGEKIFESNLYDKCVDAFIQEYDQQLDLQVQGWNLMEGEGVMTRTYMETRTEREFMVDFIACMSYLWSKGYTNKRKKMYGKKKEKLDRVLKHMEEHMEPKLYLSCREILQPSAPKQPVINVF